MYTFDRVTVCLETKEVFVDEVPQDISTRAFDILELLIRAKGQLVTKDEIMRVVWPDNFVADNNIHVHMSALRKLFGGKHGWIRTHNGRGYRLRPSAVGQRATSAPTGPLPVIDRERIVAAVYRLLAAETVEMAGVDRVEAMSS
jgi:DNA-binding winged helix-turn-helix (wHTH) protein